MANRLSNYREMKREAKRWASSAIENLKEGNPNFKPTAAFHRLCIAMAESALRRDSKWNQKK